MAHRIKFLPRWLILIADLGCVLAAMLASSGLLVNFDPGAFAGMHLPVLLGLVLAVNLPMFYLFRTYTGMVRYTSLENISRFLVVNIFISLLYLLLNITLETGYGAVLFPFISINYLMVNFLLIGYRLVARRIVLAVSGSRAKAQQGRTKAVIYGVSEEALWVGKLFNSMQRGVWKIVALMNDDVQEHRVAAGNMPVFRLDGEGIRKIKQLGVKTILVHPGHMAEDQLERLINLSLNEEIHIERIPPLEDWLTMPGLKSCDTDMERLLDREPIRICVADRAFAGKVVLVTGAAGSIGSELVRQLAACGPELIVLCDNAETPLHELVLRMQDECAGVPVKSFMGNICDYPRMRQLFEKYSPSVVFHAAAYKHVPLMEENPSLAVINNIHGTKILAELSVASGVTQFIMISTDKAVNPTNIMGASKRIGEIFVQSYYEHIRERCYTTAAGRPPTRFITTRFGNVLGSNGSVVNRFRQQLRKGGPLTVTHPDVTRYFMTIAEACSLVIEAGSMGKGGEIFVFDMGRPVKIVDLARKMIALSAGDRKKPVPLCYTGLRPGEKLYEELLDEAEHTLPTHNAKIMIAMSRKYEFSQIAPKIRALITAACNHREEETVRLMKELMPEYISKNSVYEEMDKVLVG